MNRKPIFDAVRLMLGRGFTRPEVKALDLACDLAENAGDPQLPPPEKPADAVAAKLGALSEEFESGGRGPGTVSGGHHDAGGVSYGTYQLSSKTGTCRAFMRREGKAWEAEFGDHAPGSPGFSAVWKAVAAREAEAFARAQHAFIERTHYRPVVKAVRDRKGLDIDLRTHALRDVAWSCAVQHARAPDILIDAIDATDTVTARTDPGYDRKLIEAAYAKRIAYVLKVASNDKLSAGTRNQLISITRSRYPAERAKALAMLDAAGPAAPVAPNMAPAGDGTIDGNVVAAANGVAVKSSAVKIAKLHPSMAAAIVAVAEAARELGLPQPVITSGNDSHHMHGSLHFRDRALDFRGNNIKVAVGETLAQNVAKRLGSEYDVLFEVFMNRANNHLHVEYDPD